MKGIRVGQSHIGQGVFATRRFRAQETIGQVDGAVVDDPEYGSDYCIGLDDHCSLEPAAPFRFLNHSCEPNCTLVIVDANEAESGQPEIWVEAVRSIGPGEQLTIDYAWPADAAIPCACGSESCRGWVVDLEEIQKLRREQLAARGQWQEQCSGRTRQGAALIASACPTVPATDPGR